MRETTSRPPRLPLWLTLFGPPVVWMTHLVVTYGLVYVTCRPGGRIWFYLATLVALAAIGTVTVATWPERTEAGSFLAGPGESGRDTVQRVAWLLSGFFLLVTLMGGVATVLVSPCL